MGRLYEHALPIVFVLVIRQTMVNVGRPVQGLFRTVSMVASSIVDKILGQF